MLITNRRVVELALKYLTKELTEIDLQELNEYINYSEENRNFFFSLTNKSSFREKLAVYSLIKDNRAKQEDKLKIALIESKKSWSFRRYRPILYAASVIILFSIGGYLYHTKNNHSEVKKVSAAIDHIYPGGNKAILTLNNGKQINLSDARNGQITKQAGIKIEKRGDGEIAFSLSDNSTLSASNNDYNIISTPLGGQYQIVLSDGSKIWLNSGSSLRFPTRFKDKIREVTLTGEGYFEIANNSNSSFQVIAENTEIHVLGTKFNVSAYKEDNRITTTLIQGSVKVALNQTRATSEKNIILKPFDQSVISSNGTIKVNHNSDTYASVAWMKGVFYFKHSSIQDIMCQLARWYNLNVEYKKEMPNISFSGEMLKSAPLSQILEVLKESKINLEVKGNVIIVSE